ncbi:MAG: hypothetical protein ACK55I_18920, partial [bacterium]
VGVGVECRPGGEPHDEQGDRREQDHDRGIPEREPGAEARRPQSLNQSRVHSRGPGPSGSSTSRGPCRPCRGAG